MPSGTRPVGPVGRAVAHRLSDARDDAGMSFRMLGAESGLNFSQVNRMLAAEKSMTLDEFAAICSALRLNPVEVIREAEAVVAARAREEERERLLADLAAGVPVESLGLAASRHPEAEAERRERVGLPVVGPEDVSQDTGGDEPA